jgi:hypothetical protein
MKIVKILLAILFAFKVSNNVFGESLKCENEGCYEVIKTFAKLLEEKINETDKVSVDLHITLRLFHSYQLVFIRFLPRPKKILATAHLETTRIFRAKLMRLITS